MSWLAKRMKWLMLVSGVLTCTMIYAAIAPQAALRSNFGSVLEGPVAEIVVRNWGVLIALVGLMLIYGAFIEGNLDVARHLARVVHNEYFHPTIDDFKPRTMWSMSNAFTSAFKKLDPVPQMQATARLAPFLAALPLPALD